MKRLILATALLVCSISLSANTDNLVGGWNIQTNQNGQVEKMIMSNPRTNLLTEQEISIQLDKFGTVVSGTVQFNNGFERDMSQKEALTYFEGQSGFHTLWDFWESQNKVTTLKTNDGIPPEWFGKSIRMVALTNAEVYGVLVSTGSDYAIKAENGNCGLIYFSMNAVKKLQMYTSN